jgi:hypothetical protein
LCVLFQIAHHFGMTCSWKITWLPKPSHHKSHHRSHVVICQIVVASYCL